MIQFFFETNSGKQAGRELKYFDEKKLKEKISRKKIEEPTFASKTKNNSDKNV